MSHIDDLIARLCPDGVHYRPLGDLGEFIRGNGLQKKDLQASGMGAIHYGQVFTAYGTSASETVSFVDPVVGAGLRRAQPGDLVIATTSENDEDVCKAVAWIGADEIAVSGDAYIYRHTLDPRYVAYCFQSRRFQSQKAPFVSGTKVRRVSGSQLARIVIPVPPVEVQREIVDVLEAMETLVAQLACELSARRRQYVYYRDVLLDYSGGSDVPKRPFGDIATIVRGASPRPIQAFITDRQDGVNWIKIGDVPADGKFITKTAERITEAGAEKSRRVKPGDFVLSNSMSFGRPYVVAIEGCIHDGWLAIKDFESSFVPDFLYHLLRSTAMYNEMASRAGAGTVQNLNADIVRSLVLPVPPLPEQARIAAALDAFDALVNDLSSGLPAEIAARRAQYEHYRDRLLSLPERVA
ncbi:MAG: restriction endonuclease subunit S [Candidatus Nanopelagicales bacterium]